MNIRTEAEFQAFTDLVTAAAVNKRLLMRVLARLENKDLETIHEEVAALDADFRKTVMNELGGLLRPPREMPVPEGSLPTGREEERRGHALANEEGAPNSGTAAHAPLGVDHEDRSTGKPLST